MTNNQKNLLTTIEDLTKTFEKIYTIKNNSDRKKNLMYAGLIRQKIEKEEDRKQRILDYLQSFHKLFIETPLSKRKELIDSTYAKIEMKKSEAIINGDGFSVNEYSQIQQYAILVFEPLINAIDYVPSISKKIRPENESKVNSFNLKSNISYEKINEMRLKMIQFGFISAATNASDFKSVFSINLPTKTVDWNSKVALKYFMQQLFKKGILDNEIKDKWIVTSNCFTINKDIINSNQFRKIKPTKSKKTQGQLDLILSLFDNG